MEEKLINSANLEVIEKSDFEFVQTDEKLHDQKFETKPVSFLKDSIRRFAKNKASIVGGCIILLIILFSIFGPLTVQSSDAFKADFPNGYDATFKNVLPKAFEAGTGFWDGCEWEDIPENSYYYYKYTDANYPKIITDAEAPTIGIDPVTKEETKTYHCYVDTYALGIKTVSKLTEAQYNALVEYDLKDDNELTIVKPYFEYSNWVEEYEYQLEAEGVSSFQIMQITANLNSKYQSNDSIYYKLVATKNDQGKYTNQVVPLLDANGAVVPLYSVDSNGDYMYGVNINGRYTVRVDYLDYFEYKYGFIPKYYFGTNNLGQDLYLRTANGAAFSLLLGLCVTIINFLIGLVWGAIAGYYGGKVDLCMERLTDILSAIPSIVIMTLVSLNLKNNPSLGNIAPIVALLIGFVATGWIGTSATTRMQFYRYKGQEYVLASRTLGAKDRRLIFRHILPNAAGTLVTSTVLMIPSVIFSESTLTYLGIINLSLTTTTSLGTLLSEGQGVITSEPYLIVFPAIVISLLMISFNLFGNGLRDAFNTTLRGED